MKLHLIVRTVVSIAAVLSPALAFAHTGAGEPSGIVHGMFHPLTGLDHLLAMLMVGILSFQMGGRAIWLVPASFVLLMSVGGSIGIAGLPLPFVEIGIAVSLIVLGGAVALKIEAPIALAVAVVGGFAVFHGYAHGAEMPESAGGLGYAIGFLLATATLHGAGPLLGFVIGRSRTGQGQMMLRVSGGLAAVFGIGLVSGLI